LAALVAGLGSPLGDDQAGWMVVQMLGARSMPPARLVALREPLRLLDELNGEDRLVVIDACRSGLPVGRLVRLCWPDPAVAMCWGSSSHGLDVGAVLTVAEQLGRLPPHVVLIGVEAGTPCHSQDLSPEVARALPALCRWVLQELEDRT
jgi:hydrogenase maturation protease